MTATPEHNITTTPYTSAEAAYHLREAAKCRVDGERDRAWLWLCCIRATRLKELWPQVGFVVELSAALQGRDLYA